MEQPTKMMKRNTAYKVWINNLHKTEMQVNPDTGFPFLPIKDKKVVRVNLFGSVISKFVGDTYGSVVIDDSSGSLRIRVWQDDLYLFEDLEIGNMVFVVGRWADFDGERYLRPEIVRKVSIDWALLRRLELIKEFGIPSKEEKVMVEEESNEKEEVEPSLVAREAILNVIEKFEEVSMDMIEKESEMERRKLLVALQDLLKEGEIFSPRAGFYKLV